MPMVTVHTPDGGAFAAYLAVPAHGTGPGVVVIQEIFGVNQGMRDIADWYAAHGFVALCPDLFWRQEPGVQLTDQTEAEWQRAFQLYQGLDEAKAVADTAAAMAFLREHPACTGKVGGVGFCLGGKLAYLLAAHHDPDGAVGYYGVGIEHALTEAANIHCPLMLHIAAQDQFCPPAAQAQLHQALGGHPRVTLHDYAQQDHAFARPGGAHYDAAAAELANLRTLEFFVRSLGLGSDPPAQHLAALWEEHIRHEFATRNTEETLATMVPDAYVNHIPVLTGGVGREELREFYAKHFIPQMPPDTEMTPLSRTIGDDQLVDEMIFKFTHTIKMDWMLPGIAPTGRRVEIPLVAIVRFRDGKLAHEHIYWDQGSVLVQLGFLDPRTLPVVGVESAKKAVDKQLPSNALIDRAEQSH